MNVSPCPLCGYDRPRVPGADGRAGLVAGCPHCGLDPREPSLRRRLRGSLQGFGVGLAALPQGLYFLVSTPGVKRWLVPPLLLTLGAFAALAWWLWTWAQRLVELLRDRSGQPLELDPDWLERALRWLLGLKTFVWLAEAGSIVVLLLVGAVAAFWTFSIVYEAVSGPFLDEIHSRVEERWFGRDPRNTLQRPSALSPRACALFSAAGGALAIAAIVGFYLLAGWLAWALLLLGPPLAFAALGLVQRDYGRWLLWVVRLEGGTLWVSVKAAAVAGLILVVFFPLKFVPGIGYVLFGTVAGFTTAVSLLDIPLERRQWSLRQRLAFLLRQAPAVATYGAVSSLLFVVPLIGPVLMVPAASVGGLWMVCRLDKSSLARGAARDARGRASLPPPRAQPSPAAPRRPAAAERPATDEAHEGRGE